MSKKMRGKDNSEIVDVGRRRYENSISTDAGAVEPGDRKQLILLVFLKTEQSECCPSQGLMLFWMKISTDILQNLVESLPGKAEAVLAVEKGPASYESLWI